MIDLADLEAKARAATLAIAEPDGSMTLVERDRAAYQLRLAATPAAVLELVERVRAAEADAHRIVTESQTGWATAYRNTETLRAIVRDLAAENPHADARAGFLGRESVSADYVRGDWRCSLCGGAAGDQEVHAVDHHAKYCPWRRAVEATKP